MYYFIFSILSIVILSIVVPIKVHTKYKMNTKDDLIEDIQYKLESKIYILGFIKIATIRKDKNNKVAKNNVLIKIFNKFFKDVKRYAKLLDRRGIEKINKNIIFKKLDLNFQINTGNQILNAYIVGFLHFLINFHISKNIEQFNTKDLNYSINISKKALDIEIDSIIKLKLVNTIGILIKFIYKLRKVEDKDERRTTTSNRKSDVNSYDFNRKYGRC
jgi:hypothetical protein